ncbi:class I SAM-dependent methyltransferase [Roseateles sp. NT4]|uniref:class I SAM-dependent methyltransferase n=1 Tax=Roseateles sp. NT4 TaxID=3453715 RepID=UPI003EE8F8AD
MNSSSRPHSFYRDRMMRQIATFEPRTILEVGCGGGTFLQLALAQGYAAEGIDPDPQSIERAGQQGLKVRLGSAEVLPYADQSFDLVVFSYTAHHIANWSMALLEALRAARLGVVILDPWYDWSIPSQAVADDFDRWCKAIDRTTGMIHDDCMSAIQLLRPLQADGLHTRQIHVEHLLQLRYPGKDFVRSLADKQLALVDDARRWRVGLDAILMRVDEDGFSDDGAILISIAK